MRPASHLRRTSSRRPRGSRACRQTLASRRRRHQHQGLVVLAVVADDGAQAVAVQAAVQPLIHLAEVHLRCGWGWVGAAAVSTGHRLGWCSAKRCHALPPSHAAWPPSPHTHPTPPTPTSSSTAASAAAMVAGASVCDSQAACSVNTRGGHCRKWCNRVGRAAAAHVGVAALLLLRLSLAQQRAQAAPWLQHQALEVQRGGLRVGRGHSVWVGPWGGVHAGCDGAGEDCRRSAACTDSSRRAVPLPRPRTHTYTYLRVVKVLRVAALVRGLAAPGARHPPPPPAGRRPRPGRRAAPRRPAPPP